MSHDKHTAGTSLVPTKETANAVAVYDYAEDVGAGFQNHTKDDYLLPFVALLQSNSPQVVKGTVEGAKIGLFINTGTDQLMADFGFVPVHTEHVFVQWVPRKRGGGFVARHEPSSAEVLEAKDAASKDEDAEFGKLTIKGDEGMDDLVETFYVYGLIVDADGNTQPGVIAFKSTGIKKYKGWMTKAFSVQVKGANGRRVNPPLFAHVYRIKSVDDKNKKGEFKNFAISWNAAKAEDCRLAPDSPLYLEAKAFRDLVTTGKAKADEASQNKADGADGSGRGKDDEIPY